MGSRALICSLLAAGALLPIAAGRASAQPAAEAAGGWEMVSEPRLTPGQRGQRDRAIAARDALMAALQGRLAEVIQTSGAASAISVCSSDAPRLAREISRTQGVRIGRTSFRLRNPQNQPPAWALPLIEDRVDRPTYLSSGEHLAALLPIHLASRCLACHGREEDIPAQVKQALATQYPDDQATGFQDQQLRGWFWVEVPAAAEARNTQFVRISPRDPRYFELTGGQPYVPVGFNLVGPPRVEEMERVVASMADHGVNYCRIWLDQPPWNVEHQVSGQYDAEKAEVLDHFLDLCRSRGIRVKMCIEWFRSIVAEVPRPPARGSFPKPLHHVRNGGSYRDMTDFLTSPQGQAQFKAKLKWYADRYGDDPAVFAWELWNEMNAVQGPWYDWTGQMLPELQRLLPRNLAVQSLGSFDRDRARAQYRLLCSLPDNDVLQVHRYLDLGAELAVCHGPVDVLAADAVAELRAMGVRKPVILTETGAVRPRHTGASDLYAKDRDGVLLHDMLFAPFFAGAAGPGHVWFWREAIDRPNHWHHFERFQRAIEGVDPPAEQFEPVEVVRGPLRIRILRGSQTVLAWCRDANSDWRSELQEGTPPETLSSLQLELAELGLAPDSRVTRVDVYDPWTDRWASADRSGSSIILPPFQRSLVLRIEGW